MKPDPQVAVKIAKEWLASQLADEGIANIGLEEVRWNKNVWEITLGFSRPWDIARYSIPDIQTPGNRLLPRTYKVIRVNEAKKAVIEMRNREAA